MLSIKYLHYDDTPETEAVKRLKKPLGGQHNSEQWTHSIEGRVREMEPRVSFTLVAFSVILTSPYVYAVDAIEVIRSTDSSDLFTNPDVNATKESASKTCGNYNSIDVGGQCDRDDCMICKCRFDKPTFLVYRRKCCNITDLITGLPSDASFKGK